MGHAPSHDCADLAPALGYVRPVFAYPPAILRLPYTTNAIKSLHMQLRKITKTRGHFPNDEAAARLPYLASPPETMRKL